MIKEVTATLCTEAEQMLPASGPTSPSSAAGSCDKRPEAKSQFKAAEQEGRWREQGKATAGWKPEGKLKRNDMNAVHASSQKLSKGCVWHFLKVTSNKCCQPARLRLSAEPFCGKHEATRTSSALSQSEAARA